MEKIMRVTVFILLLVGSLAGHAETVTIDFEDGLPPVPGNPSTIFPIDDFYFVQHGVTFDNAVFFSSAGTPNFGDLSVLSTPANGPNAISIFFDTPVSFVSIDERWGVSNFATTLRAFEPEFVTTPFPTVLWHQVDIDSFGVSDTQGPHLFTLQVTGSAVQRIDLTPTESFGFDGRFDNLTFSPIPIPGALMLFVPALGALGFIRRRR